MHSGDQCFDTNAKSWQDQWNARVPIEPLANKQNRSKQHRSPKMAKHNQLSSPPGEVAGSSSVGAPDEMFMRSRRFLTFVSDVPEKPCVGVSEEADGIQCEEGSSSEDSEYP